LIFKTFFMFYIRLATQYTVFQKGEYIFQLYFQLNVNYILIFFKSSTFSEQVYLVFNKQEIPKNTDY
jgi:hypothetical protein